MRALDRKLLRDLRHMRGQVIAVATVVACGVASFVAVRSAYDSLLLTQEEYYRRYRFADVFVSVKRAPEWLARRIAAIPGVAQVETRIVADITLAVPGLGEPATGRIVSIPAGSEPALNRLHLAAGRSLEPGRADEVLVSQAFAEANGLAPGDTLSAILNGRWQRLRIVGIALSPEYVYEIGGSSNLFPDNRRFGVLWMDRAAAAAAFDLEGAFNDVALALAPGASKPDVIRRLDLLLDRYGGLGAYGRDEQVSHRFLSEELEQGRASSVIVPPVFLGVAAFLLHIVLTRLVGTQRDQIAVLKAFGYRDATIGIHYLELALVAVAGGALAGTVLGVWAGRSLMRVYAFYYHFPLLEYVARPAVVAAAIAVTGGAAALGAFSAVRSVVRLPPAQAMQPEAPPRFRRVGLERLGLVRAASPMTRMTLRSLARRPLRAFISAFGIGLAVAILVLGRFFFDAVDLMADLHFHIAQRQDVTVMFQSPRPGRVRHELARMPGVLRVEPFRAVPVRLRNGYRSQRTQLLGYEPDAELVRVVGRDLDVITLPPAGIVLTTQLADMLAVRPGDVLTVEVLEARRPVRRVDVAATVDELIGVSAYMRLPALNALLREQDAVSGAYLAVDPARGRELNERLKQLPAVAGVGIRAAALQGFEQTLAESLGIVTTVLVLFASAIAFAIVYNNARIALSERGRELATLRVLGFTRREVSRTLLGEQALLTIAALPLGFALGHLSAMLVVQAVASDLFRIPVVVSTATYVFAAGVTIAAATVSGIIVRRRVQHLDLVAVLKARE